MKGETMQTYWELSEKERAALTQEGVETLLQYALMEQGAVNPVPPVLEKLETLDIKQRQPFYTVQARGKYGSHEYLPIVFANRDAAMAFLDLKPMIRDYNYECGSDHHYAKELSDASVGIEELFSHEYYSQMQKQMVENKMRAERNQKAQQEYDKAASAANKVTEAIWTDWHQLRATQAKHQRVLDVLAEYATLCDGDEAKAFKFLQKAFTGPQINAAFEWFEKPVPDGTAALTA